MTTEEHAPYYLTAGECLPLYMTNKEYVQYNLMAVNMNLKI